MEELDLKELFNIFWSRKGQIILIVLIFMVIGIVYTIGFTTPKYSSYTTLLLVSSGNTGATTGSITTTDLTLNSKLVSTYTTLVKSKSLLTEVINNLGTNVSENTLRNNVSVTAEKDTDVIRITVTNEDAKVASQVANEIASVFTERVKEYYKLENIQVVDKAEVPTAPSNINHTKDVVMFAAIGLVVAVVYAVILNMLDTTVKTAEDIEKLFDTIPVLVSIPVYEGAEVQKGKNKGGRR